MSELLDKMMARIDAATEGPWERGETQHFSETGYHVTYTEVEPSICAGVSVPDAEFIAHAREDLPRLLAAVRAVEAGHEPIDALNVRINRIQKVCTGCGTDDGNWQVWPCPTIRAITEALEGER